MKKENVERAIERAIEAANEVFSAAWNKGVTTLRDSGATDDERNNYQNTLVRIARELISGKGTTQGLRAQLLAKTDATENLQLLQGTKLPPRSRQVSEQLVILWKDTYTAELGMLEPEFQTAVEESRALV